MLDYFCTVTKCYEEKRECGGPFTNGGIALVIPPRYVVSHLDFAPLKSLQSPAIAFTLRRNYPSEDHTDGRNEH